MENTTIFLCIEWNQGYPGKERFDFCVNIMTEALLVFSSFSSELIKILLKWLSKIIEFCDRMSLENAVPDYTLCAQEHGRAFGYCEEVFNDTSSADFMNCFQMVKGFEAANPDSLVTKWRFLKLFCNRSGFSYICDEYHYIKQYVFSVETQFLDTPWNENYYRYILPTMGSLTTISNGFILFILSVHMSTNCNIFFLRMKSIFDACAFITQIPVILYFITFQGHTDFLSYNLCVLIYISIEILPSVFHSLSVLITLGIAFQKYIIISFPLKVREYVRTKYARIYTFLCFCIVLVIYTPSTMMILSSESVEVQSKETYNKDITTMFTSVTGGSNQWMMFINEFGFFIRTVILQCLPTASLLLIEIFGIRKYIGHIKSRQNLHNSNSSSSSSKSLNQVVNMSLTNVVIFLAAELPNTVALLYYSISEIGLTRNTLQKRERDLIGTTLDTITWLSASGNLFACLLFCSGFKKNCFDLLRCSKFKKLCCKEEVTPT